MAKLPALGLRARIVIALAVTMTLFIVLTEITVSQLVRVAMLRHGDPAAEVQGEPAVSAAAERTEEELTRLRRLVLFYMVTGAVVALLLGSIAVTRLVVRPLSRITRAVEDVSEGQLETEVPIEGSGELIRLGVSFNRMTRTLRDQRLELEQQLHELQKFSSDLKSAQDRLIRAAKLASVGTLAAGVAHEIGNPIAGVLGLLEALEGETDPAQAESYRQLIRKEIERIDRIIGELLAYARPAKQETEGPQSSDLRAVLDHVRSLLGAQKLFDRVDIAVELGEEQWRVGISRDDLTQLLVNLLLNSAQALDGKGRVAVAAERVADWRPALSVVNRPAIRLLVTDDGPGIDEAIADRIFDPFFTQRESGQGSGLGLAICQSICDRAGAEIALDLDYQGGARFAITLPAAVG
jgi:signal transduction histidine kinase